MSAGPSTDTGAAHRPQPPRERLAFLTPAGRRVDWPAAPGPDSPGSGPFRVRPVLLGEGLQAVQRYLPAAYAADPGCIEALENEIRALLALHRRYGAASSAYPAGLPQLIGYDADTTAPFVLYTAVPGEPVGRIGTPDLRLRQHLAPSLLTALCYLDAVGVVHRAISPETVLWDGRRAHLSDLSAAVPAGRPRTSSGAAPWAAPEQLTGTGRAEPRDDVWSAAQLIFRTVTGRPVKPTGPPDGLDVEAAVRDKLAGAFAPAATSRPAPAALLTRFAGRDPVPGTTVPPDPLAEGRARFDRLGPPDRPRSPGSRGGHRDEADDGYTDSDAPPTGSHWLSHHRRKSRSRPEPPPQPYAGFQPLAHPSAYQATRNLGSDASTVPGPAILCPSCLDPVRFNDRELFSRDTAGRFEPVSLVGETNPRRREDRISLLFQACPNTGDGPPHYLPVEYLMHGRPLTVALVGASDAGKTNLLAAMISEVDRSGLHPYGIEVRPANADWHTAFVRRRVNVLRSGRLLPATAESDFPVFEDALLLTARGRTRPVAFFDASGENLTRSDTATRFLAAVDALIFVVDPVRALQLPAAELAREALGLSPGASPSDPTFGTVLSRVERRDGRIAPAAALAIAKSDLLRFDAPVDRWLVDESEGESRRSVWKRESRDAYAFLHAYADRAWLQPVAECDRITAHFVSAMHGRDEAQRRAGRPRRVLEPLLSVLAANGLFDDMARPPGGER